MADLSRDKNLASKTPQKDIPISSFNTYVTKEDAAKLLGITPKGVDALERQGIRVSTRDDIGRIMASNGTGASITDEAEKVGTQLQLETVTSLSFVRKTALITTGVLLSLLFLVLLIAMLFMVAPTQTADALGFATVKTNTVTSNANSNVTADSKVLGAETGPVE